MIVEGRANCIFLFIKVLFICSSLSARPPMHQSSSAYVAIIDDFHPIFLERLGQYGISYDYNPEITPAEVFEFIKDAVVVAVRSKVNFDAGLLGRLPHLKCLARGGAGMDNIDEEVAKTKGITLLNAPEGNRDAVAEHAIGLLLGLSKRITSAHIEVSRFVWRREANRGWEIGGKTVGIIGFGNTGSAFAKKLSGFGCRVIAYDKYAGVNSPYAEAVDMGELIGQSDVLSMHVPLNQSTRGMVNADFISRMKDQSVLINTSRGAIVNTADVLSGITGGKIKGFATDVLENEDFGRLSENEKKIISDLCLSNQVIITPHVAGWSVESYERIATVLSEKIISFTTNIKNI